jgi:S1-C subfamily serine protease
VYGSLVKLASIVLLIFAAACAAGGSAPAPHANGYDSVISGTIGVAVATQGEDVVVSAVRADSAAARAGMRAGDRIRRCNGEPVSSAREFERRVLESRPGTVMRLEVGRDTGTRVMELPVEEIALAVQA